MQEKGKGRVEGEEKGLPWTVGQACKPH